MVVKVVFKIVFKIVVKIVVIASPGTSVVSIFDTFHIQLGVTVLFAFLNISSPCHHITAHEVEIPEKTKRGMSLRQHLYQYFE